MSFYSAKSIFHFFIWFIKGNFFDGINQVIVSEISSIWKDVHLFHDLFGRHMDLFSQIGFLHFNRYGSPPRENIIFFHEINIYSPFNLLTLILFWRLLFLRRMILIPLERRVLIGFRLRARIWNYLMFTCLYKLHVCICVIIICHLLSLCFLLICIVLYKFDQNCIIISS